MTPPAPDLRLGPPRRWSDHIDGIRWLPRLIDKVRAHAAGTLGAYLYGQSPVDASFLHTIPLDYRSFEAIVLAAPDDRAVLEALRTRSNDNLARLRAWSDELPGRRPLHLRVLDLDDGYERSFLGSLVRAGAQIGFDPLVPLLRRIVPSNLPGNSR